MDSTDRPLISVIMGVYNCASTLSEAVLCIQNQTYDNWELIICDDASGDNTYNIACALANEDNRITVLKNENNLTLAPTLNKCLSVAKGKYIARMDGDDVCAIDRFEKELNFLENNLDYEIVSCCMNLFDDGGVYRTIHYKERPVPKDFLTASQFCHAGCMMLAETLKDVEGYSESPKYKRVEDYDLWVRMYAKGYKGYNLQETLYSMQDDRNAIKRRTLSNRINESRVILKACKLLKLPFYKRIFAVKPIIKFFMPGFLYKKAHKNKR